MQLELELVPSSTAERVVLDDRERGARVVYRPGWLARADADRLFDALYVDAPWEAEAPLVFGRRVAVRRKSCALGDRGTSYRYSGLERIAAPWHAALVPIVDRLEREVGVRWNFALGNLYPDGAAGLGWHADDEDDMVALAPIGSLSLGATRDFWVRTRAGDARWSVALEHGSLLLMEGTTQVHYRHAVPPRKRVSEPRINLTFRLMRARTERSSL